ncbi:4-hydroxy-tetrahydrodipicolinate synthase [Saccharopolyspora taberi]
MRLAGIHVPLITPFAPDGSVAADALEALAHSALDKGAAGLVALGTTGEPSALDDDERRRVVEICASACRERGATLIVGAGTNNTRSSADSLRSVRADAALVAVPHFVRPSEAGVLAHFRALAAESPVPLIVYNIPYRTGQSVSAATLRGLAEIPGVVGVKHAVGGIDQDTVELLAAPPHDFAVLCGDDVFAPAVLALGGHGAILASAHLHTAAFVDLATAWRNGDVERARGLGNALAALSKTLFAEPSPTVLKGVLHAQGHIPTPDVRLPLLPASAASVADAVNATQALTPVTAR